MTDDYTKARDGAADKAVLDSKYGVRSCDRPGIYADGYRQGSDFGRKYQADLDRHKHEVNRQVINSCQDIIESDRALLEECLEELKEQNASYDQMVDEVLIQKIEERLT